jgi:uncharacterized BrkB/YihY/UPF0761 family membrane protein
MRVFAGFAAVPIILLYLFFLGLIIYCLALFIKLAHRGIKALDIYIEKNRNNHYQ